MSWISNRAAAAVCAQLLTMTRVWIAPPRVSSLAKLVKHRPDATLAELCELLHQAGGVKVSVWTMCRMLKKLRLGLKKRPCMPASVIRRGCVHCVGTSRSGWRRRIRPSWSL